MKHCILLFTASLLLANLAFSQQAVVQQKADFFERSATKKTEYQNQKIVFFTLMNTEGNENKIIDKLRADKKVFSFEMKDQGSCYAMLDKSVSPEYLQALLTDYGVKFNILTIKVYDKCFINCQLPDDYPVYRETGNPKSDKNVYIQQIEVWQKSNPDLWNQLIAG